MHILGHIYLEVCEFFLSNSKAHIVLEVKWKNVKHQSYDSQRDYSTVVHQKYHNIQISAHQCTCF